MLSGKKLPSLRGGGYKASSWSKGGKGLPRAGKILTSRVELLSYDRLVLATGSIPVLPPIRGLPQDRVFTFISLKDVYQILDLARVSRRSVVIGGGLLGIECAKGLRDIGLEVSLVHILDVLMEQWLDWEARELLRKKIESFGIRVLLHKKTEEIRDEQRRKVLSFSDGEEIEADFVVVATGVRPNVSLAQNSGLKVNRGIFVDDYLETSAPDVYAVGECIEHRGKTYGLFAPIVEQVKLCAKNLLHGKVEKYEGSLSYALLKVAGVNLLSAGDIREGEEDRVFLYKDGINYRKGVVREGRLAGFILYGNLSGSQDLLEILRSQRGISYEAFLIRGLIREERKELREEDKVCNCNAVSYGEILKAIKEGAQSLEDVQKKTKASTSCGSCAVLIESILKEYVKVKPKRVNKIEEYKKRQHPYKEHHGRPLSGLAEDSLIDTVPISKRITELFLGKKQFADLPRKFNLALIGSKRDSINCRYNDPCFSLARKENLYGLNVYAGGKIGSGGPQPALDLDVFIRLHQAMELSKAVFEIYSDLGNREDRNKNRLFFLVKELGVEGFRAELERRLLSNLWRKGEDLVEEWGERGHNNAEKRALRCEPHSASGYFYR